MLIQYFSISGRLPYPKLKQPQLPDSPLQDDKVCVRSEPRLSETSTCTNHTSMVVSHFLEIHLLMIVDQLVAT